MKKFLIGLIVGLLLAALSVVIVIFSLARFGERQPSVADGSTLILKLRGEIPEKPPVEIPVPFFSEQPPATVRDIWSMLRNAAADSRVKAVILEPEGVDAGWGKLQELRADLLEFKKSGKPLIAFLQYPKTREYYLATAADHIYMAPEDMLDMKGLRAELTFFKKTLDKVGVDVEVYHVGKYKDAGDMFTETAATPATREVMDSILDSLYGHLISTFSSARKRTPEQMGTIIDNGPFTSKQALERGLVDSLRFEDQVYGETKDRLKQSELKKVYSRDYVKIPGSALGWEGKKKIALLVGSGTIMRGAEDGGFGSEEGFVSGPFIKLLRKVGNDPEIQGVILRVDSPGGDAIASDEILREVKLLSKKKPLVVSMSDLAASGGYYVAMTGDPIIAYPDTYTGSIGIIYGKLNLRGLYDKLGVTKDILTRGLNADIDSDYHPLTDRGKQKLRESLNEFYAGFVSKAAEARKRKYEELEPLAQGRVWLGEQAKKNGLIDEIGGIDKAIELVKKRANIRADEKIRLVPYPGRRTIFEQLLRTPSSDNAMEAKIRNLMQGLDYKLWSRGGLMRIMPYTIKVD
jgi:protease-4